MTQAVRECVTRLSYRVNNAGLNEYNRGMSQAGQAVERFKVRTVRAMGSASRDGVQASTRVSRGWDVATRQMMRSVDRFVARSKRDFLGLDKSFHALIRTLANPGALMAGGAAVTGGAALAGAKLFDVGSAYEGQIAALTTVTGSQAAANKEFARLEKFAASTPYALEQSIEAFAKLKALGLDPSSRAMTAYGNTAGAMNKSLMDMVEAVADASTGEFERLKEFGIRSSKNGDKVTFTFKGVSKTVAMESKAIQGYLMKLGETDFAGGMDRQSQTIGGKVSTMADNFDALWRKVWLSGGAQVAHDLVQWIGDTTAKITPLVSEHVPKLIARGRELATQMIAFGKDAGPKVLWFLQQAQKVLPFVIGYFTAMTLRTMGLKALLGGAWLFRTIMTLRTLTWSTIALNAAAFAIPIAIGALLAGIAWVGYQVYQYITKGEKGIAGLRKQFPWLADAIVQIGERWKYIQPTVSAFIGKVWEVIQVVAKHLAPIAEWVFKNLIVGYILFVIDNLTKWIDQLKLICDYWFPLLQGAAGDLAQGFLDWQNNATNAINLIKEALGPLIGMLEAGGNAVGNFWNGITGGGGHGGAVDDPNFPLNNRVANQLIANAERIYTGAGRCFRGVASAYVKTFGDGGNLSGMSAYMAADQLARDKRFREVQVTPQMLQDPNMRRMLYGAIAVYNRQSGFSQKHGHIEVWDTKRNKAFYGNGASGLSRTAGMLQNARVFVPIGPPGQANVPMGPASPTLGAGAAGATIYLTQNFGTAAAHPAQVGHASAQGVGKGLNNAARSNPQRR